MSEIELLSRIGEATMEKAVKVSASWRIQCADGTKTGWFMTKAQAEHAIEVRGRRLQEKRRVGN
jgi:hypothetical protein